MQKLEPMQMNKTRLRSQLRYNVVPKMPASLEPLSNLAMNLWWSWQPRARKIFRTIDRELWYKTNQSPVRTLQLVSQKRLEKLAHDDLFISELKEVYAEFKKYMACTTTYAHQRGTTPKIAYFSAEFGFHESLPIYSGGLGILSGDHCKSASDLGLDFVGVTLFYRHGYFQQQIDINGQQHAIELDQNFHNLPVREVQKNGKAIVIKLRVLEREIYVKVWEMQVGRIKLYLLDTDMRRNSAEDRLITAQLYGGDNEMRIQQEIVLGIGGVRILQEVGFEPDVWHMNEGHSAFLNLERMRDLVASEKMDFRSALQIAAASSVFTTHTPVPAGNDAFPPALMHKYFHNMVAEIGIDFDYFLSFGRDSIASADANFSMTVLALRTARFVNGVSMLHGAVSRDMWKNVWLGVPTNEVPITHVTNGIHTKTWLAQEFGEIYDEYLGNDWEDHLTDPDFWLKVIDIPADRIWQTHQKLKKNLIEFVRARIQRQRQRNGESLEKIREVNQLLDPEILTIGFARRFATYKRATLLFEDEDRLFKILNNAEKPVQFLFAGKAHPADKYGQEFIKKVVEFSRKPGFEHRIAFIEDYDAYVGRRLYQGVDLWLNNPLRPLEASGTSGMKLPPNGGLNLSVLDGWWLEAYNKNNGWAIGEDLDGVDFIGRDADDSNKQEQNEVDADDLYKIIEQRVSSLFYARPDGIIPSAWVGLMRQSMRSVTPVYNTHRMVSEYNEKLYENAAAAAKTLVKNHGEKARELALWKEQIRHLWHQLHFVHAEVKCENRYEVPVGEAIKLRVHLHCGTMDEANIKVQAYLGATEDDNHIEDAKIIPMTKVGNDEFSNSIYEAVVNTADSGSFGVNFRVIPNSPYLTQAHELRLITWSAMP